MKKILTLLALTGLIFCSLSHAQTADSAHAWAAKVVALQQGPELDRLIEQLAENAASEVLQHWGPKLQTDVPAARQQQVKDALNAELKKCFDDIAQTIQSKVVTASADVLVPAYMEKFTVDELKQIATFFESPAIKKYQAVAPELANTFIKQLIEVTRADVTARVKQFDASAAKILGDTAPAKAAPSTSGSPRTVKPAPQK